MKRRIECNPNATFFSYFFPAFTVFVPSRTHKQLQSFRFPPVLRTRIAKKSSFLRRLVLGGVCEQNFILRFLYTYFFFRCMLANHGRLLGFVIFAFFLSISFCMVSVCFTSMGVVELRTWHCLNVFHYPQSLEGTKDFVRVRTIRTWRNLPLYLSLDYYI